MDDQAFVSCIMPTANRREFVARAVEYFLRQDYEPRELLVLDDGDDAVADLMPADERVRYVRLSEKLTVGAKRNLACEQARGELIAHWDDDDWHAPRRLSYQVSELLRTGAQLCGINRLLFYDVRDGRGWQYTYPAGHKLWLSGSTLCYRREFWAGNRFAGINVGEDARFVWAGRADRMTVLTDATFHVGIIHSNNVSPKQTGRAYWQPYPVERLKELFDSDWTRYAHACEMKTAQAASALAAAASSGASAVSRSTRPEAALLTTTEVSAAVVTSSVTSSAAVRDVSAAREAAPARVARNVFACLVHESQECVVDLVRSLRYHDPDSVILLYNGGQNQELLNHGFPFARYGALLHPRPRPMKWGWLHGFALDSLRYALEHFEFDTLTVVDSDQLAVRPGYSRHLGAALRDGVGMFGNSPAVQGAGTRVPPADYAWREVELWRPYLRKFERGEEKFVHWTFWPSTVFTRDAARDLVRLFDTDEQLQDVMSRSRIWATEEVILPTLVALLGYEVTANPCSYDYVKYRYQYTVRQLEAACAREDVFWMHPVPRRYDDALRRTLRARFGHYEQASVPAASPVEPSSAAAEPLLLTWPIIARMRRVEGWFEEEEADLLIAVAARALKELPASHRLVEVGSYCGRATVVLGGVAQALDPRAKIYSVDPHDGRVGSLDQGVQQKRPTLERFRANIEAAGLGEMVEVIQKTSAEVEWDAPITLLLVDGLHDYANVARDFFRFADSVVHGGYVAFHDYAEYYPGVRTFVNELLSSREYDKVAQAGSLVILRRLSQ